MVVVVVSRRDWYVVITCNATAKFVFENSDDASPPTLTSSTPLHQSTGWDETSAMTFTFNENVLLCQDTNTTYCTSLGNIKVLPNNGIGASWSLPWDDASLSVSGQRPLPSSTQELFMFGPCCLVTFCTSVISPN